MGKEAKIGLAVVGALAITLVVVLVMRMTGGSDDTTVAADTPEPATPPAEPDGSSWNSRTTTAPTAAVPRPTPLEPPRPTPIGSGWDVVSDGPGEASAGSDGGVYPPRPAPPNPSGNDPFLQQAKRTGPGSYDELSSPGPAPSPMGPNPPYGSPDAASIPDQTQQTNRGNADPPYSFQPRGTPPRPGGPAFGPEGSGRSSDPRFAAAGPGNYQPVSAAPKMGNPYDLAGGGAPAGESSSSFDASRSPVYNVPGTGRQADGSYVVGPNESFWTIAQRLYGTGTYFKALATHNKAAHADQDQLNPGDRIAAPSQSELEQRYPELCPNPARRDAIRSRAMLTGTSGSFAGGRTYVVQEGDTLYDIARFELGKGSRWAEIYDLNRDLLQGDFDYLTPGMSLVLPTDSTDTVTRRPGEPTAR